MNEHNESAVDALQRVSQMAQVLTATAQRVLKAEQELADAEAEYRRVSEEDFPELLREVGLTEVKLEDGRTIVLTEDIRCGITEANAPRAYKWLRDRGYDGIIKTELTVEFGKGDDEKVKRILQALGPMLAEMELAPELKDSIHWQTLKSFVKERREANEEGKVPPDDLFGVFPTTTTLVADKGKRKPSKLQRAYERKK